MGISPGPSRSNFRSGWIFAGGGLHKQSLVGKDLFSEIVSLGNLLLAWERFRKGKRKRADVMSFERNLEDNLFDIRDELVTGTYRHSQYEPFTIHDPKQRTIHKALVRDRVVHQAIVNIIEPLFETRFIYDSYSCRVGKGTHAAVVRLRTMLRSASKNGTRTIYAVKCDIRKFFASVDHEILLQLLSARIQDCKAMRLLRLTVHSFEARPQVGIPLGNLTSQLFANVYLHELDWYIKQSLKVRHYIRYCDDFVMLSASKTDGLGLVKKTNKFLNDKLRLQLHPNKIHVRTWTQGIDFLGYVLLQDVTILRTTVAKLAIRCVTPENVESYLGLCMHASAFETERHLRNKVG